MSTILKKTLVGSVVAAFTIGASVAVTSTPASARGWGGGWHGGGWHGGWGGGWGLGAGLLGGLAVGALASPYYYGYGYPAYGDGYGYPAYSYGPGYAYIMARATAPMVPPLAATILGTAFEQIQRCEKAPPFRRGLFTLTPSCFLN